MPAATVVGLQWGDEGKGKIIDAMASRAEFVVRYQGGGNAGHTVIAQGKKHVFHLVPTGILYPGVTCLIGNGAVVDLVSLCEEIRALTSQGFKVDGLKISSRAHVVFPYHKALDEAREAYRKGADKIGTTKRGIGPCYADKASRTGIRVADLYDEERFSERLRSILEEKNAILERFGHPTCEFEPIFDSYRHAASLLEPHLSEGSSLLLKALDEKRRILFEGAQGTMLDLDHGTYPYVTSSNTGAAGVTAGAGIPPDAVGRVFGILKAYTTRVGAGPFPTELGGARGETLREYGKEYGATTGRPRRCGWLDLVQLKYAVRLNGVHSLVLTKLDTLAGFGPLKVAVGYKRQGKAVDLPPANEADWEGLEPIYEELEGIPADCDICGASEYLQLPEQARTYVAFLEERLGIPVSLVSTGPEREALIWRDSSVFTIGVR